MQPSIQVRPSTGIFLSPTLQSGLTMLTATRTGLRAMISDIVQANPYLEFVEPERPQEDEWGFMPAREPLEEINWDEITPDKRQKDIVADLNNQIEEMDLDSLMHDLTTAWITHLNEHGRLTISITQFCMVHNVGPAHASQALALCRTLEPRGLFAYDIAECYALQIPNRPDVVEFIYRHFKKMLDVGLRAYCKSARLDEAVVHMYLKILRPLRRTFIIDESVHVSNVEAEIRFDDGEVIIEWVHDFDVRTCYRDMVKPRPPEWDTAMAVVRMLRQRHDTIFRVITEIVHRQKKFFITGKPEHLLPMTRADVADVVELHQTTVNRAVAGKSIRFGPKEIPLDSLFSTRIGDGSTTATQVLVKNMIERLPNSSDAIIATAMKIEHGINIARRTVAKYRAGMHIKARGQR